MKEVLRKVRRLEIKIRRMVNDIFAGEYHAVFKGQGLEFDEVRHYQYGDEIRFIDWNVTARTGEVFIKQFREERERTLFLLFDISGSEDFGTEKENKLLIGTEIASILAFSALKNNDKIGMATFTDRIEQYFPPQKGRKHVLAIVKSLLTHKALHKNTNISFALDFIRKTQKRKSIVLIISDFLDKDFELPLKHLARKHEIILIRLFHPNEVLQEGAGTIPVMDMESGRLVWINAGDSAYGRELRSQFEMIDKNLTSLSHKLKMDYLAVNTHVDYFNTLENFFKNRKTRLRS